MNDYTDLFMVIGAMVMVSILTQNANRANVINKTVSIEGQYEIAAAAIGQDIIDEARNLAFDEETVSGFVPVNIPSGFSAIGLEESNPSNTRDVFDDFDDYNGWSGTITNSLGDFNVEIEVYFLDKVTEQKTTAKSTLKKMDVIVTSKYLVYNNTQDPKPYVFSLIRSYYAD